MKPVNIFKQCVGSAGNFPNEKKLKIRFTIASRFTPDIDLPDYFGKYEFSVIPRSLFNAVLIQFLF